MRNQNVSPNYAVRDAMVALKAKGNQKAFNLLAEAKSSKVIIKERLNAIHELLNLAHISTWAPAGYTSRAERVAKELAYIGGEDYDEGCRVLKFAGNSRQDWQDALDCFGPQTK